MGKLTVAKVRSLNTPGRYGDGDGLWLQVKGPASKSWLLRYTLNGTARAMGLGDVDLVSLAEAREAALEARKGLREVWTPSNTARPPGQHPKPGRHHPSVRWPNST